MEKLNEQRHAYAANTHAVNTRNGYAQDWIDFEAWCRDTNRQPLPASPETVALYLTDRLAGCRVTTMERRLSGILYHHRVANVERFSTAECRAILGGARRQRKEQPEGKAALSAQNLRRISKKLLKLGTVRAKRDRALLLFGFAAALRRGELQALNLGDITFARQGIALTVRSSKTDQDGKGFLLGIFKGRHPETDPVAAMRAWLRERGPKQGPLFTHVTAGDNATLRRLSYGGLALVIKSAVKLVGLDHRLYAPHSLRAGCVTAAYSEGTPDSAIMRRSRHRSLKVMDGYVRMKNPFDCANPIAKAL